MDLLANAYLIQEKYQATANETETASSKLCFLKFDKISANFDLPFSEYLSISTVLVYTLNFGPFFLFL